MRLYELWPARLIFESARASTTQGQGWDEVPVKLVEGIMLHGPIPDPGRGGDAASSGYCLSPSQLSWWGTRSGPLCGWASYLGAGGDDRPKCASCAVSESGWAGGSRWGVSVRRVRHSWMVNATFQKRPAFRNVFACLAARCSRVVGLPMVAASTISLGKAAAPKKDRR